MWKKILNVVVAVLACLGFGLSTYSYNNMATEESVATESYDKALPGFENEYTYLGVLEVKLRAQAAGLPAMPYQREVCFIFKSFEKAPDNKELSRWAKPVLEKLSGYPDNVHVESYRAYELSSKLVKRPDDEIE